MLLFLTFLISLIGSILQSGLGFGSGIFLMNFYPGMFDYQKAVAFAQIAAVSLTATVTVRWFRYVNWKVLLPILLPAFVASTVSTRLSVGMDTSVLKLCLGFLLVGLSIYFSFLAGNVSMKASVKSGVVAGLVAGTGTGLFAIGGPVAAMYFSPATRSKQEYIATIQSYFFFNGSLSLTTRLLSGNIITSADFPLIGAVIVGAFLGTFVGLKIVSMLNAALLKKLIYAFIGINGVIIILQYFLR